MTSVTFDVIAMDKASQNLSRIADNLSGLGKELAKLNGLKASPDVDVDTRKAEAKLHGIAVAVGSAVGTMAANVVSSGIGKVTDFVGGSVEAFSNLGESVNAVNKIFGDWSEDIIHWGEKNANAYGLSRRAFQELATPLGAGLKNAGLSMEDVTKHTIGLTQRAADMASVFNTSVPEALEAIQAGLRGEADPLERFGVGLSDAAVTTRALADTGKTNADALTAQEKATARVNLIMDQTKSTAGDFKQTSDGLANSQRIAAARTEELQAKIGEKLAPAVQWLTEMKLKLVEVVTDRVLPAFERIGHWASENATLVKVFGGIIAGLLVVAFTAWAVAAAQAAVATIAATWPILAIIAVIAALAAGLIYAYTHCETFRKIVQTAWAAIQAAVSWAWNNVIKPAWDAFAWYLTNVLGPWMTWLWNNVIKPTWSGISAAISWSWTNVIRPTFDALKTGVGLVADAFSVAVESIRTVWNKVKEVAAAPVRFVVNTVYNDGIKVAVNYVADKLGLAALKLPNYTVGFAGGGVIPGYEPGQDTILARLSRGEAVLTPEATAFLGPANILALNRRLSGRQPAVLGGAGIPGFAGGGILDWLAGSASAVGDLFSDPVKFIRDKFSGLGDGLNRFGGSPWVQALKNFPKKAMDALTERVKGWMAGPTIAGHAVAAVGAVESIVRATAAQFGWASGSQWDSLAWIIGRESGWNPNAQNPTSTAYGLFQFLNSTWASTGIRKTSDVAAQALAGMRYIGQRYGSPATAQRFWLTHGWYDKGGLLPAGWSLAFNGTGQSELVLTADQASALRGGERHYHLTVYSAANSLVDLQAQFRRMELQAGLA